MARSLRKPPRRWILGILLLSVSTLTALSLPGLGWGEMTGPFGQLWVRLWAHAFGLPGLWLIVAVGILWGVGLLSRWPRGFLWGLTALIAPLTITWDAFLCVLYPALDRPFTHGYVAVKLHDAVHFFFGPEAILQHGLALGTLAITTTILAMRWGLPAPVAAGVGRLCGALWRGLWAGLDGLGCAGAKIGAFLKAVGERGLRPLGAALVGWVRSWKPPGARARAKRADQPAPVAESAGFFEEPAPSVEPEQIEAVFPADAMAPRAPDDAPRQGSSRLPRAKKNAPAVATLDLLEDRDTRVVGASDAEMRANAVLLRETLASFGIQGEVSEVHPGPIITRYEFTPGVGVTISQITSRQNDLALAMRARRVRLLAPIPGKAAVGVEIPNREPALISFKDVVASGNFLDAQEPLAIALGKDVSGRPFYASLEKMPHLLVAGTTGSGKSVCLNTLIVSLLLRCTPEQLRLLMIDPKMLEFTMYNDIPHLARPVVTDDRDAARALRWLTREMERRYRTLAGVGVRNIQTYHERRVECAEDPEIEHHLPVMPYIVVFVDELADLMIQNQSEIEVPIARLAQMARAVGIHLVLATQRPSVDVITGIIKANFPARIAFQVATRTDSRTVLDMNGAESLLGRGDMLFIPPGKAQAHRIHGAFLSDAEIERVTGYLRQFPEAEPLIGPEVPEAGGGDYDDADDPLYGEALRIVVAGQQGSTSMLQRRLRVGYTRAGRLMDMLERNGIVGPPDGSRARDVLVPTSYLEEESPDLPVGSGR